MLPYTNWRANSHARTQRARSRRVAVKLTRACLVGIARMFRSGCDAIHMQASTQQREARAACMSPLHAVRSPNTNVFFFSYICIIYRYRLSGCLGYSGAKLCLISSGAFVYSSDAERPRLDKVSLAYGLTWTGHLTRKYSYFPVDSWDDVRLSRAR
jgi:hypothetical protein